LRRLETSLKTRTLVGRLVKHRINLWAFACANAPPTLYPFLNPQIATDIHSILLKDSGFYQFTVDSCRDIHYEPFLSRGKPVPNVVIFKVVSKIVKEAKILDIMGLVNFPLWPGHTDLLRSPYCWYPSIAMTTSADYCEAPLLKVSIYRRIHNLMNDSQNEEAVGLLWELYRDRQDLLEGMLFKLTELVNHDPATATLVQRRRDLPPNLQSTIDLLFPEEIGDWKGLFTLAHDEPYLTQISNDLRPADNDSEPVSSRLAGWTQLCEGLENRFKQTVHEARQTMKVFLEAKLGDPEDENKDYILRDYSEEESLIDEMKIIEEKDASYSSVLLFAVSGSGKTRRIKHLLSQKYGFYFQACNLPVDVVPHDLHGPKKIDGAGDTVLLAKIMNYSKRIIDRYPARIPTSLSYSHIFPHLVTRWLKNLIHCRIILLAQFIEVAKPLFPRNFLPQLWSDFQMTSFTSEFNLPDPFGSLFQVSCLLPTIEWWLKEANITLEHLDSPLLYCLDEAQSDLDNLIPTGDCENYWSLSLLHIWADCFSEMLQPQYGPQFIYAGTSLQLRKAFEAIDNHQFVVPGTSLQFTQAYESIDNPHFYPISLRRYSRKAHLFSNFPLIKTEDQFTQMMKKQGTLAIIDKLESHFNIVLKGYIFEHGRSLLGRPKWSMTFLECINTEFGKQSIAYNALRDQVELKLKKCVGQIARTVRDEILAELMARLENLTKRAPPDFILNICWTVINSDLLDRPIAFEDNVGPQMMSEAFAITKPVKEDSSAYFIEENLAVHAAKSFFLNRKPEMVEKVLCEFQARQTNDPSSFGKSAEWFLAWVYPSKTWLLQDTDFLDSIEAKPTAHKDEGQISRFP
jgi:hypothetical protein